MLTSPKPGFTKHKPALPLYTTQDVERAVKHLRPLEYNQQFGLGDGSDIRFHDAGHVLGSAMVEAQLSMGNNKHAAVLFSGDLGRYGSLIDTDPSAIERADYLVVESTYGDRCHSGRTSTDELAQYINETSKRGGSVVMPAFALGRTQILLYAIRDMKSRGIIPTCRYTLTAPWQFP